METPLDRRGGCARAAELLQREWDEELTLSQERELEAHLEGCADCRSRKVGLAEVRALLGDWARETEPRATPPPGISIWLARFELAAAVLLIGITLWWAQTQRPEPPIPGEPPQVAEVSPVRVVSSVPDDMLCLQVPTEAPDVHVVWFYSLGPDSQDDTPSFDSIGDDR